MSILFFLLFFASIACLAIGLIKPTAFSLVFRGEISRNKIATIFSLAAVVFFELFAITAVITTNALSKVALLFILLSFASIICIIIGLIRPTIFSIFFRGEITRKKIAAIFGIATVAFFVLVAITRPDGTKEKKDSTKTDEQVTQGNSPEKPAKEIKPSEGKGDAFNK